MTADDQRVPSHVSARVANEAAADSGLDSAELLGDFLDVLASAVALGEPLGTKALREYRAFGDTAARRGVALRALLDLYLSAAWRLWRELPVVIGAQTNPGAVVAAGEVMLHAVDDAVAELSEGFQLARRAVVRAQESVRREFVDDLLTGGADLGGLSTRAATFGLDLSGPYAVAVVRSDRPFSDSSPITSAIERAVRGAKGDADALVASKEDALVVVFAAPDRDAVKEVLAAVAAALGPRPSDPAIVDLRREGVRIEWQIGIGRPASGAPGIAVSFREARDALDLAARLKLGTRVIDARDLLVHQVLLRDREAIDDLVRTLLTPLLDARGGARALLDTLDAYFSSGGNTAHTARAMHLSVRAVTYRLSRVKELTGYDVEDPHERFALNAAVLGARFLDWPDKPLPDPFIAGNRQ